MVIERKKQLLRAIAFLPSRFSLAELGWNAEHTECLNGLQQQLQRTTRLSHRDPTKTFSIYTDASDLHWAVCATQCEPKELKKLPQTQLHGPQAFISGTFSDREAHWSAYE